MDETKLLLTHMEDLAQKALRQGAAHSGFLTPAAAAQVQATYSNRRDVSLLLDGGFAGAERPIAVFLQPDWGAYEQADALCALAITYRRQDEVRHKDILGAVLGLGLSRDVLGDIVVQPGAAHLVCLAKVTGFITQQLDKVGRVGVEIVEIPLQNLPDLAPRLTEKQLTVASMRLDAVVAAAFHCSRGDAAGAILAGRVQLAHRECLNTAKQVRQGEIVSVRGWGRIKVLAINDLSRKGRQRIVLGYYDVV